MLASTGKLPNCVYVSNTTKTLSNTTKSLKQNILRSAWATVPNVWYRRMSLMSARRNQTGNSEDK